MKTLCIIQARMGATRLPGKVLMKVNGRTMLEHQLQRVLKAKNIDKVVVATTENENDTHIVNHCQEIGVEHFRGSESDVLDRYYQCAKKYPEYDTIIRLTADNPLMDPSVLDEVINFYENNGFEYINNFDPNDHADGMDVEVFTKEVLEHMWHNAKKQSEREHVTLHVRNNENKKRGHINVPYNVLSHRLPLDEPEDFEVIKFVMENSHPEDGYKEYQKLLDENARIVEKNKHIIRDEGLKKSLQNDV